MTTERMLVTRVGAEHFALPLGAVLEALDGAEVTVLPLVPRGVLGQCAHRGALLPVLDPHVVLGAAREAPVGTVLVLVADEPFALAVDDVTDMVAVEPRARRALPPGTDRGGMIDGLFAHEGALVATVAIDALRAFSASLLSPDQRLR